MIIRNTGPRLRAIVTALAIVLPAASPASETPVDEGPTRTAFRLYTGDPGAYRVTWEELRAGGLADHALDSSKLGLTHLGEPVPLWVNDGSDGLFGPGDSFEFAAEVLPGRATYHHPYSRWNVFRLDAAGDAVRRMTPAAALPGADGSRPPLVLRRSQHLERDLLLIRIESHDHHPNPAEVELPEPWFWHKLTHVDQRAKEIEIDLGDLAPESTDSATLRIHFRGLSKPRDAVPGQADHRVRIALNGKRIGATTWDGKTTHLWESRPLDPSALVAGVNQLKIRVPRRIGANDQPLIDVVLLDWVEIDYPFGGRLVADSVRVRAEPPRSGEIRLTSPDARNIVAYGQGGARIPAVPMAEAGGQEESAAWTVAATDDDSWLLVADDRLRTVERIEADRPSDLRSQARQADYLMIAHRSLIDAVRPLADFHRQRGLEVALVDVQDVYDEFNHGILDPWAIRRFVEHAYHHWTPPAPRFVLLVGDASWDTKNATVDDANYANWSNRQLASRGRFPAKEISTYDDHGINDRNLIPTYSSMTYEGHAASDNFYVAVDGDDFIPELAIGRFAVSRPEEVAGIVDKTIRHSRAPVGPWRRSTLWITNEQAWAQRLTEQVADRSVELGFDTFKIYPQPDEADNEQHQERLLAALDEGQTLVHFYGHGGRFIWRTGPPDFAKNHDLFGLAELDRLRPNDRLPVVLSMSCFTSPFDHPNADSIGEKFVRMPDRGAVAVLGASWRNMPQEGFSDALVRELSRPGTIGEAVLAAKRSHPDRIMIETYNLLGDPAAPISVPETVQLSSRDPGGVAATLGRDLVGGEVVVDWLGDGGTIVSSDRMPVSDLLFEASFDGATEPWESVRAVRIYAWNESSGADAIGRLELLSDSAP